MVLSGFELIKQGAEAKLYRGKFLGKDCILKERFQKKYRHELLDSVINKERVKAESRSLLRSKCAGVCSPAVYHVDIKEGIIIMEEIDGKTAKEVINQLQLSDSKGELDNLMKQIGEAIARLHMDNLIHGDLTTSNMIVKHSLEENKESVDGTKSSAEHLTEEDDCASRLVMIDFGLSHVSNSSEDKAVDLYVLERAIISTHPDSEILFSKIVDSYKNVYKNGSKQVLVKFDEVRARGRKRTMVG